MPFVTLRLSPPDFSVCALDFLIIPVGAARQVSTRSPFGASLGISILKPSPNLSGFRLIVANQIGKVFTEA